LRLFSQFRTGPTAIKLTIGDWNTKRRSASQSNSNPRNLTYTKSRTPPFSQEIANARDGLRASSRRSQMHAMVCELLSGDRKCARWFASFFQEIANARDGLRACPRR